MDLNVGWSASFQISSNGQSVAPGVRFGFNTGQGGGPTSGNRTINAYGIGGLYFAELGSALKLVGAGALWGTSVAANTFLLQNRRWWSQYFTDSGSTTWHSWTGNGNFSHQYALFEFEPGSMPLYGWVELSGGLTDAYGANNSYGPYLTIEGWAYDTSGAQIAAGDTGAAPEPGSFPLTGLAALVLGAAGTRRWRAARKA